MEFAILIVALVLISLLAFVVYVFIVGSRVRGLERRVNGLETALRASNARISEVAATAASASAGAHAAARAAAAAGAAQASAATPPAPAATPTPAPTATPTPATAPLDASTAASDPAPVSTTTTPAATPRSPAPADAPAATPPAAAAPPLASTPAAATSTPGPRPTPTPPATPATAATPAIPARAAPPQRRAPPEPDALEKLVGVVKSWLFEGNVPVKIGLLVMMFGVVGALKYAADAGWLTVPIEFRLAGIAAGAIGILVWGLKNVRERPVFGLSLQGGAIGILLLTVFAAFRYYHLLPAVPAFVLIVLLVAGASVLAVRQNAPALAVLGFIGGYLAPVLISTGSGNHVALFSYFAVLNAAVFAIAWQRPWRALNLLGFFFTFAIGGLWGGKYYRPELFATVEPFLVLFFFFYVTIPVLYALAGREKNGKVDGTLLFGTPLLAFPAQVALLQGDRMGLAASAVAVAAIYAGLALWAVRNPRLRTLAQSAAALGVVFATLAIPLAVAARWTSAAWALEAVGMIWLGLRQERRLTRWSGLTLLLLAGGAWCFSIFDSPAGIDQADRFLFNGYALNLAILALAHLGAAWLYDRAGRTPVVAILAYGLGLFWWLVLGSREIETNLTGFDHATMYGVFAAISAALAAGLRRPLDWPRLGWTTGLATVVALPLSFAALDGHAAPVDVDSFGRLLTWFDAPLLPWWLVAAALLLALRGLREPRSRWLPVAHLAVFGLLASGVGISLWRLAEDRLLMGNGWWLPFGVAPLVVLCMLAWRRPALAAWPLDEGEFAPYRPAWVGISAVLLALIWFVGQFGAGDSSPLPWLPVLNPLELTLLAGLVVAAASLRQRPQGGGLWMPWSAGALLTLTMMVLRGCHHFTGLAWSPSILQSGTAQTSLTVAWCVAGVVAWILGSQRRNRSLWMAGAVLLVVVLVKLVVLDRTYIGNLTGIISFMAVGGLLMIVGRIAPTPPRSE